MPAAAVEEDVQVFAEIVAGLDHVAAVTVDEGREMGRHRLVAHQHAWPILEISQPEGVGMVPRPAAADLLLLVIFGDNKYHNHARRRG